MSPLDLSLDRIEIIIGEIEELDRQTGGQYRQASDREASDIIARMMRKAESEKRP